MSSVMTRDQSANVHRLVSKFLEEYLSNSKNDVSGGEFANLIHQLKIGQQNGYLHIYELRIIERLVQIFIKDHSDLYYFSTSDQLRLLQGFDTLIPLLEDQKNLHRKVRKYLI